MALSSGKKNSFKTSLLLLLIIIIVLLLLSLLILLLLIIVILLKKPISELVIEFSDSTCQSAGVSLYDRNDLLLPTGLRIYMKRSR